MRKISPTVLRFIGALYGGGALAGCSDAQLMERFIAKNGDSDRTEAELAFASLVERHGRMVWHVCRSLVLDDHDAEDAFQATFLVLLTKAGTLRVRQTLGPWLHAVAYRTALNSRSMSTRRRLVERAAAAQAVGTIHPEPIGGKLELDEMGGLLHQAITRLPARFRAAVVLCDLEGLNYLEAAASLGIPLGTLQSRLARARRRLRERLSRQDTAFPALTPGLSLPGVTWINLTMSILPPPALLRRTCHMAVSWVNHRIELDASISNSVRELTSKGSRAVLHSKLSGIAALLATAMISGGVFALQAQTSAGLGPNKDPQSTEDSRRLKSGVHVTPTPATNLPITPAPGELNVATGQGKARVYALDADGNRIPERPADANISSEEAILDIRWAVVTGVVDHRAIQKSFSHGDDLAAPAAETIYRRVELERQSKERETWSDWRAVDTEKLYRILDNLPESVLERVDDEFRVANLVDPVPVLVEGAWKGLDVERLVPHLRDGKLVDPLSELGQPKKVDRARPPVLMLRAFDFTVEPGKTYRYRARLVFYVPLEIRLQPRRPDFPGPWSEPTDGVKVR